MEAAVALLSLPQLMPMNAAGLGLGWRQKALGAVLVTAFCLWRAGLLFCFVCGTVSGAALLAMAQARTAVRLIGTFTFVPMHFLAVPHAAEPSASNCAGLGSWQGHACRRCNAGY